MLLRRWLAVWSHELDCVPQRHLCIVILKLQKVILSFIRYTYMTFWLEIAFKHVRNAVSKVGIRNEGSHQVTGILPDGTGGECLIKKASLLLEILAAAL